MILKSRAASFVCICIPLGSTNMKIEKIQFFIKIEFSPFSSQCPLSCGYKLPMQILTTYFIGLLQLVKNWFDRIFEFMFIV